MGSQIDIRKLWFTQEKLKRISQVDYLISIYNTVGFKTQIELTECDDGEIQIQNGHHRIMTLFKNGKYKLDPEDFIIYDGPVKFRSGKVQDFFDYYLNKEIT